MLRFKKFQYIMNQREMKEQQSLVHPETYFK